MAQGVPTNKARKRDLTGWCGGRNNINKGKDLWYAVSRFAEGATYQKIADELCERNNYSISASAVRADIQNALIEWKRENLSNIDVYIAKELVKLDDLEAKARKNFEDSKIIPPHEYASLIKMGYLLEDIDALYADGRKAMPGNPAFLQTIMDIQKRRMELLGIDKGNDVASNTVVNYNFGGMKDEDLLKIADKLQDNKSAEIIAEKTIDEQ